MKLLPSGFDKGMVEGEFNEDFAPLERDKKKLVPKKASVNIVVSI